MNRVLAVGEHARTENNTVPRQMLTYEDHSERRRVEQYSWLGDYFTRLDGKEAREEYYARLGSYASPSGK